MAEVAAIAIQTQEFSTASMMSSDLEMAFQMQLNEVLAASGGDSYKTELPCQNSLSPAVESDLCVAFQMQSIELQRCDQEAADVTRASEEAKGLALIMQQRIHDRQFARSIEEMNDEDWDDQGDNFERPFTHVDGSQKFVLLFAKARQDPGHVAIAWALKDAEGDILLQQSHFLGHGVNAATADYTALLSGLAYARALGVKHIEAHGNSPTVSYQVSGIWKARSKKQLDLLGQLMAFKGEFENFSVDCVPVGKNEYVNRLAHQALELHATTLVTNEASSSLSQGHRNMQNCPICFEKTSKMFTVKGCSHMLCSTCLLHHVEIRVKENQVPVRCPHDCSNHLELTACQPFLPLKVYECYAKRLTEASIPESERVYCPFPNCSALMSKGAMPVPSDSGNSSRHPHATSFGRTECMECHRLFCLECQVPWHAHLTCEMYQDLPLDMRDVEDSKLYQLAKNQNWQRCKKCRRIIELAEGCYHMTCRCGHEFCYTCGAEWKKKQPTCKCKLWDEHNIISDPLSEEDSDDSEDDDSDGSDTVEMFVPDNRPFKTKLCRFWLAGTCFVGHACTFAHGEDELRRLPRL